MSKYGGIIESFIDMFDLSLPVIPWQDPYKWAMKRRRKFKSKTYLQGISRLENRGLIEVVERRGKKFLKLTKKGQLHILLAKARISKKIPWDGKWRIVLYDIPEQNKLKRNQFRWLLRSNNFVKLQASVFVSPYPLNAEAVSYLKLSGLIEFIRIMRVDQMDNDKELKKMFNLK